MNKLKKKEEKEERKHHDEGGGGLFRRHVALPLRTGMAAILAHELAGEAADGQDGDAGRVDGGLEAEGDLGGGVLLDGVEADAVDLEEAAQPHVLEHRLVQDDLPRRPPRAVLLDQEVRLEVALEVRPEERPERLELVRRVAESAADRACGDQVKGRYDVSSLVLSPWSLILGR